MFTSAQDGTERLRAWRSFRHGFDKHRHTEQDIVEAFASTKLQSRYIDYYSPDDWPSVFEIVKEGQFCQSGMSLLIGSTMHYLGFIKSKDLEFDVVSNHITGSEGLVLVYDDKAYNFLPGEVVDVEFMRENSTMYETHIIATDNFYT